MNDIVKSEAERWLSTKEICEHLGVGRDSLLSWINEKELPAHKVGRNWKFKVSEVDEWVRSGKASE
ncbi:MAG: helix-turn-helix domain-containing protein [Clostridia bacterium]|nr:helix-turn-helix domain-containing protein [Clostridia bacterium]